MTKASAFLCLKRPTICSTAEMSQQSKLENYEKKYSSPIVLFRIMDVSFMSAFVSGIVNAVTS